MKLRTILIGINFLFGVPITTFAGMTLTDSSIPSWIVQGEITKSDIKELEKAVEIMSKTKSSPIFVLNSEGGDVEVAIAIGRQLRHFQAQALISRGKCLSSCVLILAGAVRRSLYGSNIGIHRPYLSATDQKDYQATQSIQRRIARLVKDYLEEVNVSPSLYDAMIAVPPEKMRLLSASELEGYGILEVDPVQQELEDAAEARKYGISKVEYLGRKSEASITCNRYLSSGWTADDFTDYVKCRDSVFHSKK